MTPKIHKTRNWRENPWYNKWHLWKTHMLCWVIQSCPTLCDPMDGSLPGPSVHGILQARILEWVAVLSFRGSSYPRDQTHVSRVAGGFFTGWATREAHKQHLIQQWKIKAFLLRSGIRQGCLLAPLPFNGIREVLIRAIRQEKNRHPNWNKEVKLSINRWHNPIQRKYQWIHQTKKTSKLIGELSKVAGYKIKMQKSAVLLYTSHEQPKKEIKNADQLLLGATGRGGNLLQIYIWGILWNSWGWWNHTISWLWGWIQECTSDETQKLYI